jgi:ComF family protein
VRIGAVRAAFEFDGPLRTAIHRYKYQSEYARAPSLSALLLEALERSEFERNMSWDLVAYVPLHSRRRRRRGFDQSRLLARGLADRIGLPVISDLVRVLDTPTQVGRGAAERQLNVRDAFGWKGESLDGASVLIVDDVITTGATMIAAGKPLIAAGAGRVDGLAVAREVFR